MKQERTMVKFICDGCNKVSKEIEQPKGYPYNKWLYLYEMKLKFGKSKWIEPRDKHFCSDDCILIFIKEKLKEAKDGARK